ncbi:hypothetical protein BMETH_224_1 [methanotrophic bacterial endosymbiont of Bathymodiolus sp.]|nr:hypothetical protein BMETH_224_1 [methanotrophic bacterial endosymbiont of Bathymodiolus sp.]
MWILGTWKHTSSILAGLFIRYQHGSNCYVANCYSTADK